MVASREKFRPSTDAIQEAREIRAVLKTIGHIQERTLKNLLVILHAQNVTAKGQTIQYIDVSPKGSATENSAPCLIVVPGWTDTTLTFAPLLVDFIELGRRIFSVCNLHGIDTPPIKGYPIAQLRKAMALLACLDAKGITRGDVIGYSEGGVVATIAAHLRPGLFRNIVLYNSAGLQKRQLMQLVVGACKDTVLEIKVAAGMDKRGIRSVFQKEYGAFVAKEKMRTLGGGLWRSIEEVVSLSKTDICGKLRDVQSGARGEPSQIAVVFSQDDKIFPVRKKDWSTIARRTAVPLHHFLVVPGTHLAHMIDVLAVTNTLRRALMLLETEWQRLQTVQAPELRERLS